MNLEVLFFVSGIAVGALPIYYVLNKRIEDYKYFAEDKVDAFVGAFEKGYETQNHVKPFTTGTMPEPAVYQQEDHEEFHLSTTNDDVEYEERIDGAY